ncbi:MAG: VIT domain-containing protein [Myxococcales bacterium]
MTTAVLVPLVEVPADPRRGLGLLEVLGPKGKVALPLGGVTIQARVVDRIAEVDVEQKFRNDSAEAIEATYVFPLGGAAAVSRFELRVAGRTVVGKVEERGEARREYVEALEAGKRAALLEQDRDDVFTLQVGNIPAGEEAVVRISYAERLPCFEDGEAELRLPLVVAPRYVGGEPLEREPVGAGTSLDTDRVPDASRLTPPRLAPGFDPKVALSVEVELFRDSPEATFEGLACSQHATRTSSGPESIRVSLARSDEPLDRDFVLRFRLGRKNVRTALLVHEGGEESIAFLSIIPPAREGFLGAPRDVVFVLDRSGSMEGVKIASAARACGLLLRTLGPRDRFSIAAFSDAIEWMDGAPVFAAADEHGQERGEKWLREVEANGGTELESALGEALHALASRKDGTARAPVVVLLTDGQVADEAGALRRVQREVGEARLFCVGIDTAVNAGLLTRLAALGGGTASLVEPGATLEDALRSISREIGAPLVVDLSLEDVDAGLVQSSLAPQRLPDLFAGRAAFAAFRVGSPGKVRVKGKWSDGRAFEETVEARRTPLAAVARIWAGARVADLEDRFRMGETELKKEIIALGVRYSLLTRFTAFVAVDGEVVNRGRAKKQIVQPVAMPAGWAQAARPSQGAVLRQLLTMQGNSPTNAFAGRSMGKMKKRGGLITEAMLSAPPAATFLAPAETRASVCEESTPYEGGDEQVEQAIALLVSAMADARVELDAGRIPDAAPLERARDAVLSALAGSAVGQRMPALQRLLRAGMVELIAALRSKTAPLRSVVELFETRAKELDAARREARGAIPSPSSEPFWEATI